MAQQQEVVNPRTGRAERVFVNLEAVYPNPDDPSEELCFEELRAKHRGWLDKDWSKSEEVNAMPQQEAEVQSREDERAEQEPSDRIEEALVTLQLQEAAVESVPLKDESDARESARGGKGDRVKKLKVKEINATQTSKRPS